MNTKKSLSSLYILISIGLCNFTLAQQQAEVVSTFSQGTSDSNFTNHNVGGNTDGIFTDHNHSGPIEAPDSLVGLEVDIHDIENLSNGELLDLGVQRVSFGQNEVKSFEGETQQYEFEPYSYEKLSPTNAVLMINNENGRVVIELIFVENGFGEGIWNEQDGNQSYNGTLTFHIMGENNQSGSNGSNLDGNHTVPDPGGIGYDVDGYWPAGVARDEILTPESIEQIYILMLGKDASHEDIAHWMSAGQTTSDLVAAGQGHPDFLHGDESNTDGNHTVPDPGGIGYDVDGYWPAGVVRDEILTPESIEQIYILMLGKDASHEDIAHWMSAGQTTNDLVAAGQGHPDFLHGDQSNTDGEAIVSGPEGGIYDDEKEFEPLPLADVEDFVMEFISKIPDLEGLKPVRAQKVFDAISETRFIYEVAIERGLSLYFNNNKEFIHAGLSDEFAEPDYEFVTDSSIIADISAVLSQELPDVAATALNILEVEKEFSSIEGNEYVYNAIFDFNGTEYDAHISANFTIFLISEDDGHQFVDEWRPVTLPDSAKEHILQNYSDLVGPDANYHVEERPSIDGQNKELVAFLDDGTEVIFDENGSNPREFNPFKDFEQNLDAGLKFDASRSSGFGNAKVQIKRVPSTDQSDHGSMLYRISLTNSEDLSSEEIENLNLADHIEQGHEITLTFTYEVGPPRYLIASASNVSGFKHRMPEWDRPGSFTIKAKSVEPVASASNTGSILSSFGLTVEMGGERFYEGAIFETNVINLDVGPAVLSSPWDPAASFKINGVSNQEVKVRAYLPRRLLSGYYGIMDPEDVRAALLDENGTLSYITGSVRDPEEGLIYVGNSFERMPFKGFEQSTQEYNPGPVMGDEGRDYLLDDLEFGINSGTEPASQPDGNSESNESLINGVGESKFDFNGDGFASSYLEVSFRANVFPAEIQIGDPFVDPFANLNDSDFGSVSGTVTDDNNNSLDEFDVWFFKVPQAGQDLYSGEPVFFDLERGGNGTYTANLPAGEYHAEAFAYDHETDTPYRPMLAGGFESPTIFTVEGNTTSITGVNFSLEAEYRMSQEFAEVQGTVTTAGGGKVEHVFFDLFPVLDGVRQTDYPVHSFGIDREGKIKGMAPVGTFEVEAFSPDNSYYLDAPLDMNISAGQMNDLGTIQMLEKQLVTVRGSISDSSSNPIWAEIVFIDPSNPEDRFWPMWDESVTDLADGDFAVKIPEGNYQILAERFDGMYQSTFYDADSNGTADTVSVNSDITGIDFVLQSRPTATVTIQLLDSNGSAPVKYAWFDFFDAEDEYAPIVFPHLGMIDFESGSFDGNYTLSVPGGSYKLSIGAPEYEGVFRVLNEAGQVAWQSSTWEDSSALTLTDGNSTALGTVSMKAFEFSEAELYGFEWLEEGEDLAGGTTITGTVKTSSGIAVPKARIIAHSVDYIFWFDHVQTRSDGTFELKNLPDNEWVVFAEPPFDSETFQGFRESNGTNLSTPTDANQSLNLVLQGSNVFGRILFPKKNRTSGETKNQGLGNAFVWAYKDEDQDGEPDWDDDIIAGTAMLSEAFGETDKNGFFSFYLEEAGKYSLRIDIPGQLSALTPDPIGFTLKNPSESMKLGNAIKIDWKSDVRATAFDIERKSSTASSYVSLFAGDNNSSKPSAQGKTFVDPTVRPGETYNYRVVAETTSGQVTLDTSKVRVSEPIIYLAPPSKTISGRVVDGANSPIANAEVVAWREEGEGWSSTFTEDDGSYELTAGPGKWEITVYRPYDTKVDWLYDSAPKRVKFLSGSTKETKTKNFTVSRMSGGKIVGMINLPSGVTADQLSQYVMIDAFDPEGRGNWSQPESNGTFEIPLQPGEYELSLWIDPQLKGFGSPPIKFVRIGTGTVDIGTLDLTSRDKTLSGTVKTSSGTALPNVEVWAWSDQGGWVSDTTNISGEYSLSVSPGRWEVGYDLPMIEDGSEPPYLSSPPKRLKIKDNVTSSTLDFTVREAGARVSGVVYGPNGNPVSDLGAWVYAREYNSGSTDGFDEILAEVPLSSKGTFTFPGLPGDYMVGIWIPPGASYGYVEEKLYKVEVNGGTTVLKDANDQIVNQASFTLSQNDSVISGTFKLSGQAVSGITGEVYAIRVDGEGWQSSAIEDNGTYELVLAAGNWALDYYIEADVSERKIPRTPAEPTIVKALQSGSVVQDFTLTTASASISGKVVYESNSSAVVESTLYVWAYREGSESRKEYFSEVETDENGTFSISVLPGGKYDVGAWLSKDLRDQGFLDSLVIMANLSSGSVSDLNLTISKPSVDNFISGTVLDPTGNAVTDAVVYAWSDDGREAYVETDANGSYSLLVPEGAVWHVGAEYALIDENGSESFFSTDMEVDVNLKNSASKDSLSLNLAAPDFEIPDGASVTFDPTMDFVTQLPDGTELTIPGGAANVDSSVTEVRIVITPTAKGLSKSADEKPADYGYSVELFDNKGKKVEGNFKKDVILSIPVDVNATIASGMDINNVEAMYYSTTKDAWDKAKTSTWDKNSSTLTMTTDHFTTFAAVSTPDVSDISSGLAKIDDGAKGDWYTLNWLGYFYDASGGWIFHTELGWLYAKAADSGNYWFYDSQLGWLWTGPQYFDSTSSNKAYFYSVSEAGWLYFEYSNGQRKFYSYTNSNWSTPSQ